HVEREDQPILIIDECRIDFVLYGIALAAELRTLIGSLHRFAFLVFPLVRNRIGLRVPFPRARKFDAGKFRVEGVADPLDFPKRVKAVGLGHLFGNRWALLRPRRRGEDQQQHAEGGKADHIQPAQICHERPLILGSDLRDGIDLYPCAFEPLPGITKRRARHKASTGYLGACVPAAMTLVLRERTRTMPAPSAFVLRDAIATSVCEKSSPLNNSGTASVWAHA